jgi:membrane-associated phospholipid phosphatase
LRQLSFTVAVLAMSMPALAGTSDELAGPATSKSPFLSAPELPSLAPSWSGLGADVPLSSGDGRRTMGRFGTNLGRNMIGVFRVDSLKPFAIGAALAGTGALLDGRTERFFQLQPRAPRLGSVGHTLGSAGVVVPVASMLFVAGRGSQDSRFRAATYDLMQATRVTQTYTTALKLSVQRTRPNGANDLSFPSGHTSNAFAWATVAHRHYGKKAGILGYGAAGLIGISRMERDVHHLSDVLAGAAIGYVVGRTVVRENGEPVPGKKSLTLVPMGDPSGRGAGLGLSLSF